MTKISKVAALASSLAVIGLLIAPASLADTSCTISLNGAHSTNICTITVNKGHKGKNGQPSEVNSAVVSNSVNVVSNTGGNKANDNTGGNIHVDSGNSNVNLTITNTVNSTTSAGL